MGYPAIIPHQILLSVRTTPITCCYIVGRRPMRDVDRRIGDTASTVNNIAIHLNCLSWAMEKRYITGPVKLRINALFAARLYLESRTRGWTRMPDYFEFAKASLRHHFPTQEQARKRNDGLCECGCGESTRIVTVTNRRANQIKGRPLRFVHGHQSRLCSQGSNNSSWKGGRYKKTNGYVYIYAPKHPRAVSGNEVREHIIIAENVLGRLLPETAEIHHVNERRDDNRTCNLVICESHLYHMLLHQRLRAYKSCGHAAWRKCRFCGVYDEPVNLYIRQRDVWHRSCMRLNREEAKSVTRVEKQP